MVFLSTAVARSPGVSEEGIGYFILTLSRFRPLFPPPRATVFEKRDKTLSNQLKVPLSQILILICWVSSL